MSEYQIGRTVWANARQWDSSDVVWLDEWDSVMFSSASCYSSLCCKSRDKLDVFFHNDICFNESISWIQSTAWRREVEERTCHSQCHVFQIQSIQENNSSQKWSDTTGAECPQLSLRRVGREWRTTGFSQDHSASCSIEMNICKEQEQTARSSEVWRRLPEGRHSWNGRKGFPCVLGGSCGNSSERVSMQSKIKMQRSYNVSFAQARCVQV